MRSSVVPAPVRPAIPPPPRRDPLLERALAAASLLDEAPLAVRREMFAAQGRHVVLPDAVILAQVFSSAIPARLVSSPSGPVHRVSLDPDGEAVISGYCSVVIPMTESRRAGSLDVRLRPGVGDAVARSSVLSDGYSLWWEVVVFDDHAVVYVKTDQIIASRVVAVVHPRSVPFFEDC